MRIAYLLADQGIPYLGTKGASVHARAITAALDSLGHEVTAYVARVGDASPPPEGPSYAPISNRDRMVIYLAILMALFLAALDQTIVATALPKMVEDLQGIDRYAWVATAYLLASTALALVYGKLADT